MTHVQQRFYRLAAPVQHREPRRTAPSSPTSSCRACTGWANGGLLGKGLGDGQPFWTPLVQSDLIFTAFGEEIGLTGVMALLLLYGLFVQRGLRTAMLVKDDYSKLLASGLSFMFALQVFVIVGGVTRADPAHRHHHPVPVPGRVEPGGELAARRGARAAERCRAPPGAAPDPGRGDDSGGVAPVTGMNRSIKRISLAVLVMFVVLLVNVNYLQAVEAPSLANRPLNDRTEYEQNQVQRGNIVTADGVTIATSKPSTRPVQVAAGLPGGPCTRRSPATTPSSRRRRRPTTRPASSARRTPCSPAPARSSRSATSST